MHASTSSSWSSMILDGQMTKTVYCLFILMAAAAVKSLNINLLPYPVGKTVRTSLLRSNASTSWRCSVLNPM